jgi:hypothetical protein
MKAKLSLPKAISNLTNDQQRRLASATVSVGLAVPMSLNLVHQLGVTARKQAETQTQISSIANGWEASQAPITRNDAQYALNLVGELPVRPKEYAESQVQALERLKASLPPNSHDADDVLTSALWSRGEE